MGCCYVVVLGKKMSFPWGLDSECGALLTPLSSPLHNVFKWKSNSRIQICTYLIILSQIVFGNPENIFSFCTFCTALAKEFGNFQIVEYILQKCELENLSVKYYKSNLGVIMKQDNKNPRNEWNETPLHFAARKGHLIICKYIVGKVEDKNPKCMNGRTPLHYAAIKGHLEVCLLIMPKIRNKNTCDINEFTPLHITAYNGH